MTKNLYKMKKNTIPEEVDMAKSNLDLFISEYKKRAQRNRIEFQKAIDRMTDTNRRMSKLFGFPDVTKSTK